MLRQKSFESSSRPPINHDIQQWLKHRQEVLVHYTQLCSIKPFEQNTVEEFCQLLMDYISFGHFKMFEKLAEFYQGYPTHRQTLDITLLNKISLTTGVALDFNDKYTKPKTLEKLSNDLSYLGENLASRMEWEDTLISAYSQFCSKI